MPALTITSLCHCVIRVSAPAMKMKLGKSTGLHFDLPGVLSVELGLPALFSFFLFADSIKKWLHLISSGTAPVQCTSPCVFFLV